MSVEIRPLLGLPGFVAGDDLGLSLVGPLRDMGAAEGDVVVVTQKAVSKCEDRLVEAEPRGRGAWIASETRRVVARRGELVIAETRHGFVCANAGVDESNVPVGMLSLLPDDPDLSARTIRATLQRELGVEVAVIVTDTFGRPWRAGVVNVAIGCAGLTPLVDLRGTRDASGRILEATVVALADELAAASGLVLGKSDQTPCALIRGARVEGDGSATELVRERSSDMFRYSPLQAISSRRTVRSFSGDRVPRESLEAAVRAACAAPAPHHTKPWMFAVIDSTAARSALLSAMADAWRVDLRSDGTSEETIGRRIDKSYALLGDAPVLIVPAVRMTGANDYPDGERREAEREMFILSAGAAIQNLLLGLHAQGLASSWISSTIFCKEEVRTALGLEQEWEPMGTVAAGWPGSEPPERPEVDIAEHLRSM